MKFNIIICSMILIYFIQSIHFIIQIDCEEVNDNTICTERERIRREWNDLTKEERDLYIEALAYAMQSGLHYRFIELHAYSYNRIEAHGNCGFLIWHRVFIEAYENMLRTINNYKYKCITIPYWNYFRDTDSFLRGSCDSLTNCSQIAIDLGGKGENLVSGIEQTIAGRTFIDACSTSYPCNHFCTKRRCLKVKNENEYIHGCVPRLEWDNLKMQPFSSSISLLSILTNSPNFTSIQNNIEQSFHNGIHDMFGPVMRTVQSPSEPIFFNHHSTVELIYLLYQHCMIGPNNVFTKQTPSNIIFQGCSFEDPTSNANPNLNPNRKNIREIHIDSIISMKYPETNNLLINIQDHPLLGRFFKNIGKTYKDNTDGNKKNIKYEYSKLLQNLINIGFQCTHLNDIIREQNIVSYQESSIIDSNNYKLLNLLKEAEKISGCYHTAVEQLELMACQDYAAKFEQNDFSIQYKKSMNINYSKRCTDLNDKLKRNEKQIIIPNWREKYQNAIS